MRATVRGICRTGSLPPTRNARAPRRSKYAGGCASNGTRDEARAASARPPAPRARHAAFCRCARLGRGGARPDRAMRFRPACAAARAASVSGRGSSRAGSRPCSRRKICARANPIPNAPACPRSCCWAKLLRSSTRTASTGAPPAAPVSSSPAQCRRSRKPATSISSCARLCLCRAPMPPRSSRHCRRPRGAGTRIDVQMETPQAAFSLAEFVRANLRVMLRHADGPRLVNDPCADA